MAFKLERLADLDHLPFDEVIDARSPSEYAEDHLPGAVSLPVLDDDERARVGTIYVQESRFRARRVGAALVSRNVANHLEGPLADKPGGWKPLVYCWRGGQRSGSFALILREVGWRAETLEGGWRSWRRLVVGQLYDEPFPAPVVLLDGNTGTGKTDILASLAARGVQVIDLEGLANHRGSLLGAREDGQPSQKMFEGRLAMAIARLDSTRPVVIEAESSRIGRITLPPSLWKAMRAAPRMVLEVPLEERARYLVRAYADVIADRDRLLPRIEALRPYQPREVIDGWRQMVSEGRFEALAADLMARHYDARYARQRARFDVPVRHIAHDDLSPGGIEAAAAKVEKRMADLLAETARAGAQETA